MLVQASRGDLHKQNAPGRRKQHRTSTVQHSKMAGAPATTSAKVPLCNRTQRCGCTISRCSILQCKNHHGRGHYKKKFTNQFSNSLISLYFQLRLTTTLISSISTIFTILSPICCPSPTPYLQVTCTPIRHTAVPNLHHSPPTSASASYLICIHHDPQGWCFHGTCLPSCHLPQ